MKKIFLLIIIPSVLLLTNCKNQKSDDVNNSTSGIRQVQIKINGNSLSLMVPDSTKGKVEVVDQSWGATEIKVGKDFQISISEGEGDIALKKSDIAANDVNKFKRYVKDEAGLLFWESQITEPEFHFFCIQKVGTTSYNVEDIKGDIFSEPAVQSMIDAVKSMKAETSKPNS
jgi:hypothetical protein